jgi:uncharacterized protein YgiM (DUF1202 family)
MKRILVAFLAVLLIFSLTAVAFAEKYKVVTEKDRLNVRDPVTHAEIGKLPKGSTIDVKKIKGGWAYITYKGNDAICWAKYLKKVSSSSTPPSSSSTKLTVGGKAKVTTTTGQNLNLREDPALDAKVLRVLSPGYHVTVLEIQSKWVKIKAGSYEGWVWRSCLKAY